MVNIVWLGWFTWSAVPFFHWSGLHDWMNLVWLVWFTWLAEPFFIGLVYMIGWILFDWSGLPDWLILFRLVRMQIKVIVGWFGLSKLETFLIGLYTTKHIWLVWFSWLDGPILFGLFSWLVEPCLIGLDWQVVAAWNSWLTALHQKFHTNIWKRCACVIFLQTLHHIIPRKEPCPIKYKYKYYSRSGLNIKIQNSFKVTLFVDIYWSKL